MQKREDLVSLESLSPNPVSSGKALSYLAVGSILQTIGETLSLGTSGALPPGSALLIVGSTAPGVVLFCAALWQQGRSPASSSLERQQQRSLALPAWLGRMARGGLLAMLALAALWTLGVSGALLIQHPLDPSIYDSDAAAFIHYQAEDVLRGINPYTDADGFWQAVIQFPQAGATPLQRGQFGQQRLSPDAAAIAALLQQDAQNPSHAGPEFDPHSLHSYPAGSFLLAVPFIWAGFSSTQPLYLLCLLLLFALLLRWSPPALRWQTVLLLLSLSIPITLTLRSSFEIVCVLCIIGAWRAQPRHPWLAAVLLGVGCAVKQLTWLFLPFYLVWVWRQRGWRGAALAGAICALVFFVINAPFLLAAPAAWANSMPLPITEPAFPGGLGLIALSQGGLLPIFPSGVYTALEIIAYLGLLAWFSARQIGLNTSHSANVVTGAWGLLLASLPLLLGPRSLISYTMFLPVLALAALFQIPYQRASAADASAQLALASRSPRPGVGLSNE